MSKREWITRMFSKDNSAIQLYTRRTNQRLTAYHDVIELLWWPNYAMVTMATACPQSYNGKFPNGIVTSSHSNIMTSWPVIGVNNAIFQSINLPVDWPDVVRMRRAKAGDWPGEAAWAGLERNLGVVCFESVGAELAGVGVRRLVGVKAARVCEAPSGDGSWSRRSTFERPLAVKNIRKVSHVCNFQNFIHYGIQNTLYLYHTNHTKLFDCWTSGLKITNINIFSKDGIYWK